MKSNYDNVCSISHYTVHLIFFSLFSKPIHFIQQIADTTFFNHCLADTIKKGFLTNYELLCVLFYFNGPTKKETGSFYNLKYHIEILKTLLLTLNKSEIFYFPKTTTKKLNKTKMLFSTE